MKKTLFLFFMLYFTSLGVAAATEEEGDRWYEVEIIVFSHQADPGQDGEVWPEVELPASLEQAIVLAPPLDSEASIEGSDGTGEPEQPDGLVTPYQMLSGDQLKMDAFDGRLVRAADFTPLIHAAWRQPAFPRGVSMPLRIHWEQEVPEEAPLPEEEALITPPQMPESGDDAEEVSDTPSPSLTGTLTVSVNRYLHLDVDLYYQPEVADDEEAGTFNLFDMFAEEETPRVYRMHQSRRMRSSEIHYLDHPRFGLIVQVTPYEYPRKVEEEGEETVSAGSPVPGQ